MGGRGASSSGGDGLPAKFRSALGRKGKPIGVATALRTANKPRYYDDIAYRINCQRCIYAYEMQRRGYKVKAQANWSHGADGFARSTTGGYRHVFEGQEWEPVPGARPTREGADKFIRSKMDEWGDGARAAVNLSWSNRRSGHVFNVEKVNGKVMICEAQTGRKKELSEYLNSANPGSIQISRLDNLTKPTDNLLKCIEPL